MRTLLYNPLTPPDFGDTTDIESKSLTLRDPSTGEQTSSFLSLPNGCLCCSFKDMGIAAIEEMAVQQGVDWVMVELTGVADPGERGGCCGEVRLGRYVRGRVEVLVGQAMSGGVEITLTGHLKVSTQDHQDHGSEMGRGDSVQG